LLIRSAVKITVCLALVCVVAGACVAQQSAPASGSESQNQAQPQEAAKTPQQAAQPAQPDPAPADPAPTDAAQSNKDKSAGETSGKVAGTSNDRLFYTLPNFLTLQGKQLPPMSSGDKYKAVAVGSFDFVEYPWWGVLASISQANNSEPAFRQGWGSYAKRYGETAGDSLIENFMVGAVFPAMLHQDPRFYQSGEGGPFRRTGYAMSRIVVTLSDSGHTQFNYSEIFGAALAGAISTYTYHPKGTYISTPTNNHLYIPSDRTPMNVVQTWGTQMGLDTLTLVVKEFWPDIHRKISHKYRTQQESAASSVK